MSVTPPQRTHPGDRLVWTSTKSGGLLDEGAAMTLTEAMAYVEREFSNSTDVRALDSRRLSFHSQYGFTVEYIGAHPLCPDPHAALSDFAAGITGWSPAAAQGEHLITALRAAIDGAAEDAAAGLLALLAATGARQ